MKNHIPLVYSGVSTFQRAWLLSVPSHHNRDRWLILIGALKLVKAIFFVSMGFGVIKLLHKDLADVLLHITSALRIDPENRAVNVLLNQVELLNPQRLKLISLGLFLYAGVDVAEGLGLIYEKVWAEYFTLILTASFLPWEFYEIFRHVTLLRVLFTLVNVLVVLYLLYVIRRRVRQRFPSLSTPCLDRAGEWGNVGDHSGSGVKAYGIVETEEPMEKERPSRS